MKIFVKLFNSKHHLLSVVLIYLIFTSFIYCQSPVPQGAELEKIADGFQFVEGPVWVDGVGLLFSDIPANIVYQWTDESGTSEYLNPSGNSNGLALDLQNRLLLAQHGNRRLARIDSSGFETALATHYDGKKLNSPNDIAVKSDGSIFFTDPPYGISPDQEELGFYGIYRLSPSGSLQLMDNSLQRPNGIAFSPDETKLYVGDSEANTIFVWNVTDDTLITDKQQFAYMDGPGGTDGMKVDEEGHLFSTGPYGVWVFATDGTVLDTIVVPGQTTNCNWGDDDRKTLYITSGSAVYRIRTGEDIISSSKTWHRESESIKRFSYYPNPFNGETIISYTLAYDNFVSLKVYDMLGNELETLVNEKKHAGKYEILFNSGHLSGGIYFCQLQAGNESIKTKKMILF
ncbi:MAG: SMP-30/gluconolactonase/LRE family protein [Bacteroidales bacterium]|nr:MAG: SMP-30/gluconolactonase/LRE family protein [Bacteroidales bacterium]